ncbi:MAG: nucleotide exchange factor GrpE [Gammaproteobacteria bacterium]|nr:nucleotide exchange factor GrpE [Gammaproteobacteria bacterium]
MSKKEESPSTDKWRDLAEQEAQETPEQAVDDAHFLPDEALDNKSRDQLALLEKQVDFYKDQAARALAEGENVRRRAEQDVSKARKFGAERLLSELIPVADSLVRGLEGTLSDDPKVQLMRKGMELTLDILNKLLEKNGVVSVDPKVGDVFDPAQHEAMSMRSEPDAKSNTVLQVLQKGYALHGRVLRAAMVIVNG